MSIRISSRFLRGACHLLQRRASAGDASFLFAEMSGQNDRVLCRKLSDSALVSVTPFLTKNEDHVQTRSPCVDYEESDNAKKRHSLVPQQKNSLLSPMSPQISNQVPIKAGARTPIVPDKKLGRFVCKQLCTKEEIEEAQNLLFKVYIEENGWMFSVPNPTGFHLQYRNGRMLLMDCLEEQAIWIGVVLNGQVLSCARVIQRDEKGQLDIDRYGDSMKEPIRTLVSLNKNPNLIEVQRCATHPDFRNIGINGYALGHAAEISLALGVNVIGTTPVASLRKFLIHCQGEIICDDFDYGDGNATTVFYWKNCNIPNIYGIIESLFRANKKKRHEARKSGLPL